MNWPKILTKERVEPLTIEERGALLTGIVAIAEGLPIKKSSSPYLEMLLDSVRREMNMSKRNAANGKKGGNPALKSKQEIGKTAQKNDSEPVEKTAKAKRFVPPQLEEVAAYCRERNNGIDPEAFVDHYETNGWRQGKGAGRPIKDWKACVRTWENKRKSEPQIGPNGVKLKPASEQLHDLDELF